VIEMIWILTEGIDYTMRFLDKNDVDWRDLLSCEAHPTIRPRQIETSDYPLP
jgi:hypothetical protein